MADQFTIPINLSKAPNPKDVKIAINIMIGMMSLAFLLYLYIHLVDPDYRGLRGGTPIGGMILYGLGLIAYIFVSRLPSRHIEKKPVIAYKHGYWTFPAFLTSSSSPLQIHNNEIIKAKIIKGRHSQYSISIKTRRKDFVSIPYSYLEAHGTPKYVWPKNWSELWDGTTEENLKYAKLIFTHLNHGPLAKQNLPG